MQLVQIFEGLRRMPEFWEGRSAVIAVLRAQVDCAAHLFAHVEPECRPAAVEAVHISAAMALREQMLVMAMDDPNRAPDSISEAFGRSERARLLLLLDEWLKARRVDVPPLPAHIQSARAKLSTRIPPAPAKGAGSWAR